MSNLFSLYRKYADSWMLFYNSGRRPRVIALEANGELRVSVADVFGALIDDINNGAAEKLRLHQAAERALVEWLSRL